eukprot:7488834-Alexandrium_andersonii.AAC.1
MASLDSPSFSFLAEAPMPSVTPNCTARSASLPVIFLLPSDSPSAILTHGLWPVWTAGSPLLFC